MIVPFALAAGVYVRSPVVSSMSGCTLNRPGLKGVSVNVSVWPISPPALIEVAKAATVCGPASSRTVWSGSAGSSKLGGSLTSVTVTVKTSSKVPPLPSSAWTRIERVEPASKSSGPLVSSVEPEIWKLPLSVSPVPATRLKVWESSTS